MDIERQRIINLLQVIHSDKFEGGVGACADACGIQRPNLTAMLNGRKAFGWAVARKIETALDLSPMSLDGLGEAQVKLSQLISTLDAEQQERIRHWVEFEAQTAEARILAKKLHRSPTKGREKD